MDGEKPEQCLSDSTKDESEPENLKKMEPIEQDKPAEETSEGPSKMTEQATPDATETMPEVDTTCTPSKDTKAMRDEGATPDGHPEDKPATETNKDKDKEPGETEELQNMKENVKQDESEDKNTQEQDTGLISTQDTDSLHLISSGGNVREIERVHAEAEALDVNAEPSSEIESGEFSQAGPSHSWVELPEQEQTSQEPESMENSDPTGEDKHTTGPESIKVDSDTAQTDLQSNEGEKGDQLDVCDDGAGAVGHDESFESVQAAGEFHKNSTFHAQECFCGGRYG